MSAELDRFEQRLRAVAGDFPYPPTPVIRPVRSSRPDRSRTQLAWGAGIALALILTLLAVPQVRAALVEFIQIGAVRLNLIAPTPTATLTGTPAGTPAPTEVLTPSATPLASVLDLKGETTLADAKQRANFTVRLPAYPADLGQPDHVFVQAQGAPVVVLAWLDPDNASRVQMSLHEIGPGSWALDKMGFNKEGFTKEGFFKAGLEIIRFTDVNGQNAAWVEGPHLLIARNDAIEERRLVTGNTLIWQDQNGVTYRLETELPLAEARKIAESLK